MLKDKKLLMKKVLFFLRKKFFSQENVYDAVSFNKVANLQCSDCNFAIKKINYIDTLLKMCQALVVLKNHILRKKSVVDQLPNKVPTM